MASSRIGRWQLPGLVLIFLLALVPTARGADIWTMQNNPPPNSTQEAKFAGVSCTAANACLAVGYFKSPLPKAPPWWAVAQRWDGEKWWPLPAPGFSNSVQFLGVSCTSASACIAVGMIDGDRLAMTWNGSTWIYIQPPLPVGFPESKLEAVACTSSTACTAVGYQKNGSEILPLAYRWNGEKWTIQATPTPVGSEEAVLNGVACPSAGVCTAVGSYKSGGVYKPLSQSWSGGSSWEAPQTPPSPAGALETKLAAISCSGTSCQAVGYYKNSAGKKFTLAERLKLGTWEVLATPNPAGATEATFQGISCTSETMCIGTGRSNQSPPKPLAERWNGVSWELMSTPSVPAGKSQPVFAAISCSSAKTCMATGDWYWASTFPGPVLMSATWVESP